MTRLIPFAVALAALVGVFFLPSGSRASLGVLSAYEAVLEAEVPGEDGAPARPLHEVWFDTEAFRPATETEPAKFLLGGVRFADMGSEAVGDFDVHGELRTAIVRGLRQVMASDDMRALHGEIALIGDQAPAVYGLNLLMTLDESAYEFSWSVREQPLPGVGEPPAPTESVLEVPFRAPGPISLLPPMVAIALAVLLRRPVASLFLGVLVGAYLLRLGSPDNVVVEVAKGFGDVFRVFFWKEASDGSRLMIVGFVIAMLAMVGVITKNGGIRGLMNHVAKLARSARSTQIATYLMGLLVFFDDYANTILVGSTMRPLTDRFRIAREKLAYIVDSTAAPVAGLSIFSTWIAFEVSTFSAQLPMAGLSASDGYSVFIDTLPYRFYCILSLAFVALVTTTGRDFGPMLAAEKRARRTGQLVREGGTPMVGDIATAMEPARGVTIQAWRALVPLLVFVGVTCFTILQTGGAFADDAPSLFTIQGLSAVLGGGDSYLALWRGSSLGLLTAVLASLAAGLRLEIVDAAWKTLRSTGVALAILYLAWMIGAVCGELNTAHYLTALLENMEYPLALPVILFVLSGAIAFATGSSWSTMSILLPLVVGLSYSLGERNIAADPESIDGYMLMVLSIGAVLEGSIFGDHCSPISDTTVLSSVASASDHIDHVRTQAPYAALTMVVAIAAGYLPAAAFGLHPGLSLLAGVVVLWIGLRVLGERADEEPSVPPSDPSDAPLS